MATTRMIASHLPDPGARNPADGDLAVEVPGHGRRRVPARCTDDTGSGPVVALWGEALPRDNRFIGFTAPPRLYVAFLEYADGSVSGCLSAIFPLEGPGALEELMPGA